jgi:hypothetical protein
MALKNSMKRAIVVVGVLVLISMTAVAQEIRSEISVQGTGFFTKDTQGNGVLDRATETGGFLVGYRYNFNRWLAAEAARKDSEVTQRTIQSSSIIRPTFIRSNS